MARRCAGNSSDLTSDALLGDGAPLTIETAASDGSHLTVDTVVAFAYYNVGSRTQKFLERLGISRILKNKRTSETT